MLEGGQSFLFQAVGVVKQDSQLDKAWKLALRPWKFFGKTRPELPPDNVDWRLQKYRFALRRLKNRPKFRRYISEVLHSADGIQKWWCRGEKDRIAVIPKWTSPHSK